MDAVISRTLVKSVQQVIDDDGSVKDSAVCFLLPYFLLGFLVKHISLLLISKTYNIEHPPSMIIL